MKTIQNQNRFSVHYEFSKTNSETLTFATLEEAQASYDKIAVNLLDESNALDIYHWRNNTEGLSVCLRELTALPQSEIDEYNECETEEQQDEMWIGFVFDYSKTLQTAYTYLSNDWDENLGKNGEFIIKLNAGEFATFSTLPFSKEAVNIVTGATEILKGGIE